ncbi:MAG TPA: DUF6088 family protein [Solirubrobacterales bacterium]|nr:DUF6088 family protein [Solirubrobacterales bacterium]
MPKPKQGGRGPSPNSTATRVYERVQAGGERYWSLSDFRDLPATAVAHALSRLAGKGELQRLRKGLYYRAKQTALGPTGPSASGAVAHTLSAPLHPAGLNAGTALGFSTQNPARPEFATPASAVPGALRNATVYTRRPTSRFELDASDGALLELLRDRARYSDLSPSATARRLVSMLSDRARFERLAKAALSEPPRVRAMLGALGEQANAPAPALEELRESLNPISKFDFGMLSALPNARAWQAR